ncbi:PepSY-associated TM helix domain-containing protein [Altererythrobacter arenosus]|uniref:PepSY-associated TM helix domain-containing protein n=1 Tax=Altererythrobacter arenosus TaxID=3032592 RepID=A0ABY8FTP3_9SPHN|nr:PepSY-associated TM helix domain-containing protein [Altererythrobacter sp. CAU 1644]WFL78374.1 PepSY-associated TM helix domain-containing protein [Altererythrobacter sp. CAU 1644]
MRSACSGVFANANQSQKESASMRKWHRWLSVFFGVFILFIAATGLLSHWAALWPVAEPSVAELAAQEPPPGFACPEGWRCSPPRPETGPRAWVSFFHHLHSGETFGPVGQAISILSGFALLFFAFSGLWLYIRMWRERAARRAKDRWFWK